MLSHEEVFALIDQAVVRELTDEEVKAIGLWAFQYAEDRTTGEPEKDKLHPLVAFLVLFTKRTRPTPLFSRNFKKISPQVVPHVAAYFRK